MSTNPITADNIVDSVFLCDIYTMSGTQTLMVCVHNPHTIAGSGTVYDAHAMCCSPLSRDDFRPGVFRDAVVTTALLAGDTHVAIAIDTTVDDIRAAEGIEAFILKFDNASNIRPVAPLQAEPAGIVDDGPCRCPECCSDDVTVQIPVPLEAYRVTLGQCAVAYQSSLDNGFDPDFVSNAIDQAVEDTLLEHIELHFARMAASVCADPDSESEE